jgi:hypothetical protein
MCGASEIPGIPGPLKKSFFGGFLCRFGCGWESRSIDWMDTLIIFNPGGWFGNVD